MGDRCRFSIPKLSASRSNESTASPRHRRSFALPSVWRRWWWTYSGIVEASPSPTASQVGQQEHLRSTKTLLRKHFFTALKKKQPEKVAAVIFHHDNALAHRLGVFKNSLHENNYELVPQASYSPHLGPSDYWLFPTVKHSVVVCFQCDLLLHGQYPSGLDRPSRKSSQQPCRRSIDIAEVYRTT